MYRTHNLEFDCCCCKESIVFSLFSLQEALQCAKCAAEYHLQDEGLKRQLELFVALCQQVRDSKEILANTSIGIDIAGHSVAIPYNLLLTRFTSSLNLMIGKESVAIRCRVEPITDLK
jgi:hypothetical protein